MLKLVEWYVNNDGSKYVQIAISGVAGMVTRALLCYQRAHVLSLNHDSDGQLYCSEYLRLSNSAFYNSKRVLNCLSRFIQAWQRINSARQCGNVKTFVLTRSVLNSSWVPNLSRGLNLTHHFNYSARTPTCTRPLMACGTIDRYCICHRS